MATVRIDNLSVPVTVLQAIKRVDDTGTCGDLSDEGAVWGVLNQITGRDNTRRMDALTWLDEHRRYYSKVLAAYRQWLGGAD